MARMTPGRNRSPCDDAMPEGPRLIFTLPPSSGLSGGLRTLLEHIVILRAAGVEAYGYHLSHRGVAADHGIEVPMLSGNIVLSRRDVVVRSELTPWNDLKARSANRIRQLMVVQNHYYVHSSLGPNRSYADLGVTRVAASSEPIRRFLHENGFADGAVLVPYAVSPATAPAPARRLQVAYMPRKRKAEGWMLRGLIASRYPDLADVPWVEIDGAALESVKATMAQSAVFLSLQRLEGFGLPALEAMAAGCLVTGFTGGPGNEYATPENGLWAGEDDIEAALHALALALRRVRDDAPEAAAMIGAGLRTAASYNAARRDAAVIAFYTGAA